MNDLVGPEKLADAWREVGKISAELVHFFLPEHSQLYNMITIVLFTLLSTSLSCG